MPKKTPSRTITGSSQLLVPRDNQGGSLTDDQVDRWADLIADGKHDFPADVSPVDRNRLADVVRERLRRRLVQLIARAIAARLHRRTSSDATEGSGNA